MNHWDKKLIREQLDNKLKSLNAVPDRPPVGWVKTIREALGMTTAQLAKRVGINRSRVTHIEQAEVEETLKLSTLNKVAEGLGMKFVYGFMPKDSLETLVRDQAKALALRRTQRLDHTMRLELQNLDQEDKEKAIQSMIDSILIEGDKELWDIK